MFAKFCTWNLLLQLTPLHRLEPNLAQMLHHNGWCAWRGYKWCQLILHGTSPSTIGTLLCCNFYTIVSIWMKLQYVSPKHVWWPVEPRSRFRICCLWFRNVPLTPGHMSKVTIYTRRSLFCNTSGIYWMLLTWKIQRCVMTLILGYSIKVPK